MYLKGGVHWNSGEIGTSHESSDSIKEWSWSRTGQPTIDVVSEAESEQALDNLRDGNGFSGFVAITIDDIGDDRRSD
jgi:hypothetical protein